MQRMTNQDVSTEDTVTEDAAQIVFVTSTSAPATIGLLATFASSTGLLNLIGNALMFSTAGRISRQPGDVLITLWEVRLLAACD